jgi:hypothetical protein
VAVSITLLVAGSGVRASAADSEDPRASKALTACTAGQVPTGVALLAELYTETRDPAFIFNQGRCYQQNGQLDPAAERFREYLRVGKNEPAADRARAEGFIKEIEARMERRRTDQEASPEGRRRSQGLATASIALGALGVAAVGTGVFLSLQVQSKESQVQREFANGGALPDSSQLKRQLSDGGRLETWQWVSYGVGVAALAGAATTLVLRGGWPWSREGGAASVTLVPVTSPQALGGVVSTRF